jgi:hypothetical protein
MSFKLVGPSIDKVAERVEQVASEWLSYRNRAQVIEADEEDKTELNRQASARISREFGLALSITHFLRRNAPEEDVIREAVIQRVRDCVEDIGREASRDALHALKDRLVIAVQAGDYDEIPRIRKLIEEMESDPSSRENSSELRSPTTRLARTAVAGLGHSGPCRLLEGSSESAPEDDEIVEREGQVFNCLT